MKKFLLLITILIPFFCCSCKSREVIPTLRSISFGADISFYNELYSLEASINEDGIMEINVTSPDNLKGLKLTYTTDGVTAEYMGISYTPKSENMPLCSVSGTLYEIIKNVDKTKESAVSDDGNCIIEGKLDNCSYTFIFSPAGLPLHLEVSSYNMTVEFKNVTLL